MLAQASVSVMTVITGPTEKRIDQAARAEGYRLLLVGIIDQAAADAKYRYRPGIDPAIPRQRIQEAIEAREWLAGPDCEELCEAVRFNHKIILGWLITLPPLIENNCHLDQGIDE